MLIGGVALVGFSFVVIPALPVAVVALPRSARRSGGASRSKNYPPSSRFTRV
jgi:hypothetical protein